MVLESGKKKMTKEERKAAKIRAAEKKRLRREERRSARTRRYGNIYGW